MADHDFIGTTLEPGMQNENAWETDFDFSLLSPANSITETLDPIDGLTFTTRCSEPDFC